MFNTYTHYKRNKKEMPKTFHSTIRMFLKDNPSEWNDDLISELIFDEITSYGYDIKEYYELIEIPLTKNVIRNQRYKHAIRPH